MKSKLIRAHMKAAFAYAECSTAERAKVGCVIVKDDRIISIGYNGMPSGWTNICESEDYKTKPEVLHAESNAVAKLARSAESGMSSVAFVTMAPCLDCAKLLYQAGVSELYYAETYRDNSGLNFLLACGIPIHRYELS